MRRRTNFLLAEVALVIATSACVATKVNTNTAAPTVRTPPPTLPAASDLPRPKRLWHRAELRLRGHPAKGVSGEKWISVQDGAVTATDIATGRSLWTRTIDAGAPRVFGGTLFVQADGRKLMALDPSSGATLWTSSLGCGTDRGGFVVEGDVAIGSFHCGPLGEKARVPCEDEHETLVLSLRDGKLIRRTPEAGSPKKYSGVSRGRAIARRHRGFSKAGTGSAQTGEPQFEVEATDVLTGKELWKVEMQGVFDVDGVIGDVVILAGPRTAGLDAASGRTLWMSDLNDQPQPSLTFYVLDGRFIRVTKTAVEAIDPLTGRIAVRFEMPSLAPSAMGRRGLFVDDIVVGNGRVTASLAGYLVVWDANGRRAFQSPAAAYGLGVVVGDVALVAVPSDPGINAGVTAFSLVERE